MAIDWAAERTKYVTGDCRSLKEYAELRGLSYSSLRKRSKGWDSEREQHRRKVGTMTEQLTAEKKAEMRAAATEVRERLSEKIWVLIERAVDELKAGETVDTAQLRRVQQVYTDLLRSERPDENGDQAVQQHMALVQAIRNLSDVESKAE